MSTTIAAIASPPGGGLRGIVRLSGPRARAIVESAWAGSALPDLAHRGIHAGRFRDRRGELPLLLLWMPAPRSYTREDVAELHLPGSPPLLQAALERVLALGAVPAAPGEFTRRAFLSGRIDLTRAEGVLALVGARNESERRAGHALLSGGLGRRVAELRDRLDDVRALVEAALDFEERDTGHVPAAEIYRAIHECRAGLSEALAWEVRRATASGEPQVVLAGAPNAGKSALFNRLAGGEHALVTPFPGTTRDALSVRLELADGACRLWDTAGVGDPLAEPDRLAQDVARAAREAADLVLWVVDAARAEFEGPRRDGEAMPPGARRLLVWNKVDLANTAPAPPPDSGPWVAVSALAGTGIEVLRERLARALWAPSPRSEPAGLVRELSARHRLALERAAAELDQGLETRRGGAPLEILAEHLRAAVAALDDISGRTTPEDILDRIFSRFCLGK